MGAKREPLNQKSAIKLLERHGWVQVIGGRHTGLTRAILRQAGIE